MSTLDDAKLAAARAALRELPEEGLVGLGSGTTARIFVEEFASLVRAGRRLVGVPTSVATRDLAASLGIPLMGEDGPWNIAVNVDGADEVSAQLDLIKGGGAAHTREKIVNYAALRNVIIVDDSKLSARLGERWAVPVEVLVFAQGTTRAHLEKLGKPALRTRAGVRVRTDAGNLIYDLTTGPIEDPGALDRRLRAIPGVVETGLFVQRANVVLVAGLGGVRRLTPGLLT